MKHQTKLSFTLIGRSILIEGTTVHEQHYSKEKTAFYAQLFKEGMLGKLMPHSLDKKGYALIVPHKDGIQYYAGVAAKNAVAGYESILVPEKDYLVSSASGEKSRLLFDQLEDNFSMSTPAKPRPKPPSRAPNRIRLPLVKVTSC